MRVIGNNSHGFANEREIRDALNSKRYDNINPNLRHLLDDMFSGYNLKGKWVHATTISQRMKPDFYVTVDGVPQGKYVSVKEGCGNSLHQESLESFITFLKNENVPEDIINYLLEYHFSDGTTNNTGQIRYTSREYAKKKPEIVSKLNDYFSHSGLLVKIVDRFVFKGNYSNAPTTDYIYHGTSRNGVWASRKELFDYINTLESIKNSSVCFGPLTYQAWNKNLKRKSSAEHKRLQMQVKCSALEDILTSITCRRPDYKVSGNYEGELSEKASVIAFNKNPESILFNEYLEKIHKKPENILLIRVTTKQLSKLSNQKVNTRADAYAIEITDNRIYDILEENNYYLDEEILDGYDSYYNKVEKSGISIKKDSSENFTLIKLTPNSFNELFGCYELGYGASVFCRNINELHFNIQLLDGWKTTIDDLQEYFVNNNITEISLTTSLDLCKGLKLTSCERIKQIIDSSDKIKAIIFNGKYIYEEPYSAFFFMQNNQVKVLEYIPYTITTGSGRSHGEYSIVLKPQSTQ